MSAGRGVRRRRLRTAARAAVLLAIATAWGTATGVATPAAAQEQAPVEPGVASYAVVVTDVSIGPSGEETERSDEGILRLACSGGVCRVVSEPGFGFLGVIELSPGAVIAGVSTSPPAGSPCAGGRGARSIELDARVTGFAATLEQQPVDWTDCPDGTEGFAHARTITWTGSPLAVDECIFRSDGCPAAAGVSLLASGDAAAPSVLSALVSPAQLRPAPVQLAWAAVLSVVLVLLVAFPTALLNSAVEAGADRLTNWRARRRGTAAAGEGKAAAREWTRSWWWAAAGVLVASVISAFVDPGFGFNPGSARLVLSIFASFLVDVVVGWLLVIWIMRRVQPGARHTYAFRPLTLLVVLAAVLFTRLTGFEPGIVFGLVAGVVFTAVVGVAAEAKAALVTLGYAFAAAAVAWVLYAAVAPEIGESAVATFAGEALASTAIAGVAALPIALLPLGTLPGRAIWAWRRTLWAACYAGGLFAFFVVLMPMPFSWAEVAWELWAWVGVYAAYAAAAVIAWLVLARPWHTSSDDDEVAAPSDGRRPSPGESDGPPAPREEGDPAAPADSIER